MSTQQAHTALLKNITLWNREIRRVRSQPNPAGNALMHALLLIVLLLSWVPAFGSDEKSSEKPAEKEDKHFDKPIEKLTDEQRRSAAVGLNYSRASLHRIRRNPSIRVMLEEQEKILNRLDLNGIADEEVLKLYYAVLEEVSLTQIADRDRVMLGESYRRAFQRELGLNAFEMAAQATSGQYLGAVRTGAASWWDYRVSVVSHDLDVWQVDKKRMISVVEKSSQFLDVSWKMARCKQIPDRWLVRNDDLDNLDQAQREPDPAVRLRILKRMEGFMECYPPYLYYVARTQQSMGQLVAAIETYEKLVALGSGHFRKDEMLAAALANRALIQSFLSQPAAVETAKQAMKFSSEAWEANLVCASVLQKYRRFEDAEDAILRNLDVNLERVQSKIALIALYYASDNKPKMISQLQDPDFVRDLPARQLVMCAAKIGQKDLPIPVIDQLTTSLQGTPRFNLGRDDFVVAADPTWKIQNATVTLQWGDRKFSNPRVTGGRDSLLLSFDGIAEFGNPLTWSHGENDVSLTIKYANEAPLKLVLKSKEMSKSHDIANLTLVGRRHPIYQIVSFEQNEVRLSLRQSLPTTDPLDVSAPVSRSTAKPVLSEDPANDDSPLSPLQ